VSREPPWSVFRHLLMLGDGSRMATAVLRSTVVHTVTWFTAEMFNVFHGQFHKNLVGHICKPWFIGPLPKTTGLSADQMLSSLLKRHSSCPQNNLTEATSLLRFLLLIPVTSTRSTRCYATFSQDRSLFIWKY